MLLIVFTEFYIFTIDSKQQNRGLKIAYNILLKVFTPTTMLFKTQVKRKTLTFQRIYFVLKNKWYITPRRTCASPTLPSKPVEHKDQLEFNII